MNTPKITAIIAAEGSSTRMNGINKQLFEIWYNDYRRKRDRIQVSLARLGAGFGSALADIFQTESLRILAERISQWGIDTRH